MAEKVDERHEEVSMGVRNDFPLSRRCRAANDDATYDDGSIKNSLCNA
jgi:hypothetical protein